VGGRSGVVVRLKWWWKVLVVTRPHHRAAIGVSHAAATGVSVEAGVGDRRRATRDGVAVAYNTCNTRITVDKGTVWLGYGHPKPIPVPKHTRDHIVMVFVPGSCLTAMYLAISKLTFQFSILNLVSRSRKYAESLAFIKLLSIILYAASNYMALPPTHILNRNLADENLPKLTLHSSVT